MPTHIDHPAGGGAARIPGPRAVQGVPFAEIAERFGTPVCVYDASVIHTQWAARRHPRAEPAYDLSANPNVALCAAVRGPCSRAVVAGQTELTSALLSGYDAGSLTLDGPVGQPGLVTAALHAGVGHVAVADEVEACFVAERAAEEGLTAALLLRVDAASGASAERVLRRLLDQPADRVSVQGLLLHGEGAEETTLAARLLDLLRDEGTSERLLVLRHTDDAGGADVSAAIAELAQRARVVVVSGAEQLRSAATVLTRVVGTGRGGPADHTLDAELPAGTTTYAVADRVSPGDPLRIGDVLATPGIGLVDLALPVPQLLSHGIPAEVLVVDGRAICVRAGSTTEYLLDRQRARTPA